MIFITRGLKQLYLNGCILARYGTLNPRQVQLVDCEQKLHVDPRDGRARRKLIAGTARNKLPRNQRVFRSIVANFQPDLVLDIGLNYGECLFSSTYPSHARLWGFEANVALRSFVEASRADHPNRDQIELSFQFVTDESADAVNFFVDRRWSGGSTAGLDPANYDRNRYELVQVPSGSIDAAIAPGGLPCSRLFFKIDVEGYEPKVLRGMRETLAAAGEAVGFIEFSGKMLRRAGFDVTEYWDFLQQEFILFVFDRDENLHPANGLSLEELRSRCGGHEHTDLILMCSNDPRPERFGLSH